MKEVTQPCRLLAEDHIKNGKISVRQQTIINYPLHWHNFFEIVLILEGTSSHIFNGTPIPISKGDAFILTPIDFHEIKSPGPLSLINIAVYETCLPENILMYLSMPDAIKHCRLGEDEVVRFTMAAKLLAYECTNQGSCTQQLLEYLLSFLCSDDPGKLQGKSNYEHLAGIRKAISYLDLHFRERISLEKLAQLSGYNPSYFSQLFRKVTGETYIDRLKFLRINYAKMILANGQSVSNACFASGFGSLSNFLAAFKEKCGMTPSEFRKKHFRSTL